MSKQVEFNLKLLETPDTSPDRARLIKELTEGQDVVGEDANAMENYDAICEIADRHNYRCAWFGTDVVYLWPQSFGRDPVEVFQGVL